MSSTPKNKPVKSRLILNFPGFEPTDSEAQLGRLLHVANKSGECWGFSVEQISLKPATGQHHTIAKYQTKGGNWQTNNHLCQFRWNDIVHAYEKAPFPAGFLRDFWKFLSFLFDGTIIRYFKTSPRYWGFTIYPILLLLIFLFVSWIAIGLLLSAFAFSNVILQLVGALLATLLLCKLLGKKTYLLTTIADWGFARDMINRVNPEIESRFDEFSKIIVTEIDQSNQDEIIIVGHSFGAIWATVSVSKALEEKPGLLKGKKVTFLALGSSILKLALSPTAGFIRDSLNKISAEKNLFWHEVQTKDDIIAFYKCDPFELEEFDKPVGGYNIDRIKFKSGMEKSRYNKMRKSFYTTHRQYILYNDKRVHFDYALKLFGPIAVKELSQNEDAHLLIDQNGNLN